MIVDITCPFCQLSKEVPSEKIPDAVKWVTCPKCRQRFPFSKKEAMAAAGKAEAAQEVQFESATGETYDDAQRDGAPWENLTELGLRQGIVRTFRMVLFSPGTFFRGLAYEGGKREPFAFGLMAGSIGGMMGFFWQSIFPGGLLALGGGLFFHYTPGLMPLIVLAMIPVLVAAGLFVYSGILHLLLLLVRGGKNGFEATFRVICYSQAAQVWAVIPFVGGWIGGIWQLAVQITGLKEIHETSSLRVVLAFLIPLFLGIVLVLAILIPLAVLIFHHPLGQTWS